MQCRLSKHIQLEKNDNQEKAVSVPYVASGDLTITPNNTTKLGYHHLQ